MLQLLNANFARLFKSNLFRICAAISALYGIVKMFMDILFSPSSPGNTSIITSHREMNLFSTDYTENFIMTAVFICLFIGREYGGVMRNKIIVGKTRRSIYLANLFTCLAASGIFYLLFASFLLITFVFSGGIFALPLSTTALYMLLQLFSILCASAVFTAVAMLIHHKYLSAVAALVLLIGLFAADTSISPGIQNLNHELMNADEKYELGMIDNKEQYVADLLSEKETLTLVYTINPIGQQTQLYSSYNNEILRIKHPQSVTYNDPAPVHIIPYSLGIIAASAAVGILVFRKEDIK